MTVNFYRGYLLLLAMFRPVSLFQRINHLSWYRDTLRAWVDALDYRRADGVLEVGCATGTLSRYLEQRGLGVQAVDRSYAMIRRALAEGGRGVAFRQADIMALPYGSASFEWVIAASVLNVVADPAAALQELVRVCREGGRVSILVPSADWERTATDTLRQRLGLKGVSAAALLLWDRLATKMDGAQLRWIFQQAGLEAIEVVEYLDGLVIGVTGTKLGARPVFETTQSSAPWR